MGKEALEALARIIGEQLALGPGNAVTGSWTIRYNGEKKLLYFEKCEDGFYCNERPAVINLEGVVVDPGGPLFDEEES